MARPATQPFNRSQRSKIVYVANNDIHCRSILIKPNEELPLVAQPGLVFPVSNTMWQYGIPSRRVVSGLASDYLHDLLK